MKQHLTVAECEAIEERVDAVLASPALLAITLASVADEDRIEFFESLAGVIAERSAISDQRAAIGKLRAILERTARRQETYLAVSIGRLRDARIRSAA